MGQSTNAIIAYGFDLGEELPQSLQIAREEDSDFEWESFLIADYGIEVPTWQPGQYEAYSEARKTALTQVPVDVIEHCSGDYPMYFLAVRGTDITARRGYPERLPPRRPHDFVSQAQIDALYAFCKRHDIEWQEPGWHIFSMWN